MFDQVIPLLASEQTKTAVIGHISQGKMGFHDVQCLSFKPFKLLVGDPYTQPCISGCRRWLPK
jgi:hypothetical protein